MPPHTSRTTSDINRSPSNGVVSPIKQTDQSLFREAAVEAYAKGAAVEGVVFEAEPKWIKSSYLLLLAALVAMLLFMVFGKVHEYAEGPVIIQIGKQAEIIAVADATIGEILISPGEQVKAGQPILQLYQAQAIADYQRLKEEFELRLRQRLMSPDDKNIESILVTLLADMKQAKNNINQKLIRAEIDGVVGDVRIRAGQRVTAGQVLISLTNNNSSAKAILFLPGKYRPQLQPGMQLQLTLDGYPYDIQYLTIAEISDEIIGPAEARQFLGAAVADGVSIQGANFIIEAELPEANFTSDGQAHAYHHGMQGAGEIKVSSEPIVVTFFPSLEKIF